jgi:hypothetical protein
LFSDVMVLSDVTLISHVMLLSDVMLLGDVMLLCDVMVLNDAQRAHRYFFMAKRLIIFVSCFAAKIYVYC